MFDVASLALRGLALIFYGERQEKREKQRLIIAVQEEIVNEFPDYAAGVSQGVAATIAAEILNKQGVYWGLDKARDKLIKQKDIKELMQLPGFRQINMGSALSTMSSKRVRCRIRNGHF